MRPTGRAGLLRVLQDAEWNVARAARVLGVTRRTVYLRLQRYGIDRQRIPKSVTRPRPRADMDPRLVLGHAVKVVLVATLVGLYVRGRSRRSLALVAYLWAALLGNSLTTFWPGRLLQLRVLDAPAGPLRRAQAPGRHRDRPARLPDLPGRARRLGEAARGQRGVATTAGFWFLPRDPPYGVLFAHQPQIIAATVWLFTITSLVIVHYRIPIDPWHRAILLAFVPYLLVFTTALAAINTLGVVRSTPR